MKKVKLSKKLLEESIVYCEDYLNRKRTRPLPDKMIKAITKLIEKKRKENDKMANVWLKSPMLKLATVELYREGKAIPVEINGERKYNYNLVEVFDKMEEILNTVRDKNMKEDLRRFCE